MNFEESEVCIDCGKKLKDNEKISGFCYNCQVKVNNDLRLIHEYNDQKSFFSENVFFN
jgi:hypothetical protein